jgi:hypothetical protein
LIIQPADQKTMGVGCGEWGGIILSRIPALGSSPLKGKIKVGALHDANAEVLVWHCYLESIEFF